MTQTTHTSRRDVLRALGVGAIGAAVWSGSASATPGKNFGNGNGIGAFLNDEAEFKEGPIWTTGIEDQTGESVVEVEVGTITSLDLPFEVPPELAVGPFGFGPRVVKVSPGTTVRFVWTGNPWDLINPSAPWMHDVVGYDPSGVAPFQSPFQGTGSFEVPFPEVGTYLYYCSPHGYPFRDNSGFDYNIVGMRGAVLVTDD